MATDVTASEAAIAGAKAAVTVAMADPAAHGGDITANGPTGTRVAGCTA